MRRIVAILVFSVMAGAALHERCPAQQPAGQQAYGRQWGHSYATQDWSRFYHYPYVFYPQNFWGADYYKSAESLYYRYPNEMRIPVYNRKWHNEYPMPRKYHRGHHFRMDVF